MRIIQHGNLEIRNVVVFAGPDDIPDVIRIHVEHARKSDGFVIGSEFQWCSSERVGVRFSAAKMSGYNLRKEGGEIGARGHRRGERTGVTAGEVTRRRAISP